MFESHTSLWKQCSCEGVIVIVIFVLLCISVPLQAAHVRVHTCVYLCARCARLAATALDVWLQRQQPPFPQVRVFQEPPGPVSVVEETELPHQVLRAGKPIPARALYLLSSCLKLFKENRDRQRL